MQDRIRTSLQKSAEFPAKTPPYKILQRKYKFLHMGQILMQLKWTSMALGFIKVMGSVPQTLHAAEILFSTIIKHKIKLSVLLYVKTALSMQHHFLKNEVLLLPL